MMPKVWYVNDDIDRPEPVDCQVAGYPNKDEKGRTMYLNSHFASEADAWTHLLRSAQAGQSLSCMAYKEAQDRLTRCTEQLAADAARRTSIEEAFDDFTRKSSGSITGA
jgi:hypothetical protein